ncbi:hypothetical protein GGI20_003905 [Coemansia sp. BCRC 34301]|nr:hypothetical protein GGI20_003905 [Coemansia sp. BCRC 34301]
MSFSHSSQQRFFAARALELLPIHRDVIHASQPIDLVGQQYHGTSTDTKKATHPPPPTVPWWPASSNPVVDPATMLLWQQQCFSWPLLPMSPVFTTQEEPSVLPELLMPVTTALPQPFVRDATGMPLLSLPSSPHSAKPLGDSSFGLTDNGDLFARISECRANGLTWQDISESSLDNGLSASQLSYLFYRRLSEHPSTQPKAEERPIRATPYASKRRARTPRALKAGSLEQTKLAYLNVDQFKQLQRLVLEYGDENWDLLGELMMVRAGDLQKNWVGYSVHTVITRVWTREEIEVLALCRAIGVCCRTTAKLIGTKLPLQCRRKTVKPHDCQPPTSVHCPPNGPMYLVSSKKGVRDLCFEIGVGGLAVARDIVREHRGGQGMSAGIGRVLELAFAALPMYSRQAVSMCMLALLASHPDYEAGQQPPRAILSAPPTASIPFSIESPPPHPIEVESAKEEEFASTDDTHRWSAHEIGVLLEFVEQNKGKKSWIALAAAIGTKTAAQCCNKYRSLRRYKKM